MDLDLTLWIKKRILTLENLEEVKIEKWEWYNQMCLIIMKCSILEAFCVQGSSLEKLSNSLPKMKR
ncbi:hypothetical protein CR513_01036, partial [Mucuna pruriens]